MFMLVSRRYERASLIVTSNKPFGAWGEIFGDEINSLRKKPPLHREGCISNWRKGCGFNRP
jgi:DNA replication protein DnaC